MMGTIRIVGKGDKERLVYLNNACKNALHRLCEERAKLPNLQDRQALFVSKRTGKTSFCPQSTANRRRLPATGGIIRKRLFCP